MQQSVFNIWKFLASLGLFLYGILLVEESLKNLSGRQFKKILRRYTNNHFNSILVGTFSTAILQSSSAVTLMLLALVGSGVIAFSNALGIILGSNLGTTFTGWIVSTLGFKVEIEKMIWPLLAIGAFFFVFFQKRKFLLNWGRFFIGFAFLFFGLNSMKESVAVFQGILNPVELSGHSLVVYALVGFLFTALIQSSSATMVITLTVLNAQLIPLTSAAALIVGADLGTTLTVILGAIASTPEKKRVAAAHFLFNFVTDVVALLLLPFLVPFIAGVVGEENPLYALVGFHSSFNLIGIFFFYPFLNLFSHFLEKRFIPKNGGELIFDIDPSHPEAALESLLAKADHLIKKTIALNLSVISPLRESKGLWDLSHLFKSEDYLEKYSELKSLEALILDFAVKMQRESLSDEQSLLLHRVLSCIRGLSISSKSVKDVRHNLEEFQNSTNDTVHSLSFSLLKDYKKSYEGVLLALSQKEGIVLFEDLAQILKEIDSNYLGFIQKMGELIQKNQIDKKYTLNFFNTNREIFNSSHALIMAIADLLLNKQQSEDLRQLPHGS